MESICPSEGKLRLPYEFPEAELRRCKEKEKVAGYIFRFKIQLDVNSE